MADDAYLETLAKMEPVAQTDRDTWGTSLAISAKRIAYSLEELLSLAQKSVREVEDEAFERGKKVGIRENQSRHDYPDTTGQ